MYINHQNNQLSLWLIFLFLITFILLSYNFDHIIPPYGSDLYPRSELLFIKEKSFKPKNLFIASLMDGSLTAIDVQIGEELWTIRNQDQLFIGLHGSTDYIDNYTYIPSSNGEIYRLYNQTFELVHFDITGRSHINSNHHSTVLHYSVTTIGINLINGHVYYYCDSDSCYRDSYDRMTAEDYENLIIIKRHRKISNIIDVSNGQEIIKFINSWHEMSSYDGDNNNIFQNKDSDIIYNEDLNEIVLETYQDGQKAKKCTKYAFKSQLMSGWIAHNRGMSYEISIFNGLFSPQVYHNYNISKECKDNYDREFLVPCDDNPSSLISSGQNSAVPKSINKCYIVFPCISNKNRHSNNRINNIMKFHSQSNRKQTIISKDHVYTLDLYRLKNFKKALFSSYEKLTPISQLLSNEDYDSKFYGTGSSKRLRIKVSWRSISISKYNFISSDVFGNISQNNDIIIIQFSIFAFWKEILFVAIVITFVGLSLYKYIGQKTYNEQNIPEIGLVHNDHSNHNQYIPNISEQKGSNISYQSKTHIDNINKNINHDKYIGNKADEYSKRIKISSIRNESSVAKDSTSDEDIHAQLIHQSPIYDDMGIHCITDVNSRFLTDFKSIKIIGNGGYGTVYKAQSRFTGIFHAVKRIVIPRCVEYQRKVLREIRFMMEFQNNNIIRFFNAWCEEATLCQCKGRISRNDHSLSPKNGETISKNSNNNNSKSYDYINNIINEGLNCYPMPISTVKNEESCIGYTTHTDNDAESTQITCHICNNSSCFESSIRNCSSDDPNCVHHLNLFIFIQMELCHNQTLQKWMINNLERSFELCFHIFTEVLNALEVVHRKHLIHRDMKPSNIFFGFDGVVKIGDFGLATKIDAISNENQKSIDNIQSSLTKAIGTNTYMSPEMFSSTHNYNLKVDIYSLGIILFELFVPCTTQMERFLLISQLKNNQFPSDQRLLTSDIISLIRQMMCTDPNSRPDIDQIKHSYSFTSIYNHFIASYPSKTYFRKILVKQLNS